MCKYLGKTPEQLRRMPYEDRSRLELCYQCFMEHKPELLM